MNISNRASSLQRGTTMFEVSYEKMFVRRYSEVEFDYITILEHVVSLNHLAIVDMPSPYPGIL